MLISYHNHTNASDGAATIREMIEGAKALGIDELGISDHFTLMPGGEAVVWSVPEHALDGHIQKLLELRESTESPRLRVGIELDFFPETAHQALARVARHDLDYIIGSVHFVGSFPVDAERRYWEGLSQERVDEIWRGYWERIRHMADMRFCDFVGHLDLPKKFGNRPSEVWTRECASALDAIAAADIAIEINTAGWSLAANEAYPSLQLLKAARERGIPLIINADAHSPAHLTRNFDRARQLARDAGYTETVRYERRNRISQPLAASG